MTVIGRDAELASVEAFLSGVVLGPRALVLSGEAGIGKTALWEFAVDEAAGRVGHVLSHRSVEPETVFSFGGISDLIAPVFEEVAPVLAPLRRRALEVALLLSAPGEEPPDPRAIGLAVLDVLRALAQEGPVVIGLDDVQWLDGPSAGVLQMALRRLTSERVGVLATLRSAKSVTAPIDFERCIAEDRLERLWVGPLSLSAINVLLRGRLGLELARPELGRLLETSGGNPFFALELGRELVRKDARPAGGVAFVVPESLQELLGGRLDRISAETVAVLVYAAALARPSVELVAAAYGNGRVVEDALDEAVREGVIAFEGSRVRFAHPLLASVCYERVTPARRREVHRALAGAVADVEERARHLALSTTRPDAAIADQLDAAAEQAASRGATVAAADLCELAAELTPPVRRQAHVRRLRAARFLRVAGDGDRAAVILERLRSETAPGVERSDVLFELALTSRQDLAATIALCDDALAEASKDDARRARILAFRTWNRLMRADVPGAMADGRAAMECAERTNSPALLAVAIARAGQAETWAVDLTPGLLERGVQIEEQLGLELEYLESPRVALSRQQMRLGELDEARHFLAAFERSVAARGDEVTRVPALVMLSIAEWLAGDWQQALEHATASLELVEQTDAHAAGYRRAWVLLAKASVETDLGMVENARASILETLSFAKETSSEFFIIVMPGLLGRLELMLGNVAAAADRLRELPDRLLAAGLNDPTQMIWADTIEALIGVGELERARRYLDLNEMYARRLGSPSAISGAARCRGLLTAAEGDADTALLSFEQALGALQGFTFPLERGRALLSLGVVLRQTQQKTAARKALQEALTLFEELGAKLWAERAQAEIRRISGRQPRTDGLTETELRVAKLAAQGRSNKQIASELFMAVGTVEAHLSRVYRKLGIRSRAALTGHLTDRPDEIAQT